MSSDTTAGRLAIEARGLGKCYGLYAQPSDRLKELLWGRWRSYGRAFWALRDVDLAIRPGEVVGIVGRNGAGKSTLLQLLCGTLQPSTGTLAVRGRVAALLELGAGFNPDFTGIENVYMNAAVLGLPRAEVDARLDSILAFADIGDFVRQPVKTYSSGMFVRLAFAVATSVEPEILVIDEALSVGDGAFARKSFDRIMELKDAGTTILFCSHSMYQVEALCQRALWLEGGRLKMTGTAADVTSAYGSSLNASIAPSAAKADKRSADSPPMADEQPPVVSGTARITGITGFLSAADGRPSPRGNDLSVVSGQSNLHVRVDFEIDPSLPAPGVAVGFADTNNLTVASVTSPNDGFALKVSPTGHGSAEVVFERLPLLKGTYYLTVFLCTEDGLHPYEQVERALTLRVTQRGVEQGLVSLPHRWIS